MRATVFAIAVCTLLAVSSCAKEDTSSTGNGADRPNDPAARDAAPGRLSETSPPSAAPASEPAQDAPPADTTEQPPRQ